MRHEREIREIFPQNVELQQKKKKLFQVEKKIH